MLLQFFKKIFLFHKIYFKVEVLKTFKTSIDYHIKACRSLKRRVFQKFLVPFPYALSAGFKMKLLRKSVFSC